jgi:hypothetical protein
MARERVRQEKLQRQSTLPADHSAATGNNGNNTYSNSSSGGLSGMSRQHSLSTGAAAASGAGSSFGGAGISSGSRLLSARSLEPLHDEYSRLLMHSSGTVNTAAVTASAGAGLLTHSGSGSNLMPPPSVSPRNNPGSGANSGLDGKLADVRAFFLCL